MHVSVTEAKAQITDLVRRAEAGEEIILTRHGQAAVRLVPVRPVLGPEDRRAVLEAVRLSAASRAVAGESAERSHDYLYGADGLPM